MIEQLRVSTENQGSWPQAIRQHVYLVSEVEISNVQQEGIILIHHRVD